MSSSNKSQQHRLRPIFAALSCLLAIIVVISLGLAWQTPPAAGSKTKQREQSLGATQVVPNLTATSQAQLQATLAAQARVQATAGITSSLGAGKVLYSDSLTNPGGDPSTIISGGWIDDGYQCAYKPDGYHVQTYIAHAAAWCYSNQQEFSDAVITAQAQLLHGGIYGLIFRLSPNNRQFYVLELNSKSEYRFVRASGKDPSKWLTLIDWTHSNAILSGYGNINTFLVLATGSLFRFYINKQLIVLNFSDATYTSGLIGFLVGGDNAGGTEAVFSNIWVFQK